MTTARVVYGVWGCLALLAVPRHAIPQEGEATVPAQANFVPQLSFENRQEGERTFTTAIIDIPEMDGFTCEIWCYEMGAAGVGQGQVQEDGSLVITHDFDGVAVTTRLVPEPGAVAFEVEASGADPAKVRKFSSVNACWQLRKSDGLGNRGQFYQDFVSRCFIYTVRGLTLMSETTRFPDTRADRYAENDERNNPPWVQVYVPIWRRHTGQPAAFWGCSTSRPIYSLIGCVSRDGKWLTAWGWPHSNALSQGWHDCLHASPSFAGCYDEATNTTRCAGRLYFMPNDPDALLTRYLADFPQEEPAISVTVAEDGRLRLAHRDLPDAPLMLRDAFPGWQPMPWGGLSFVTEIEEASAAYWIRAYGELVELYSTLRYTGKEELPLSPDFPTDMPPGEPWELAGGTRSRLVCTAQDGWAAGLAVHFPTDVLKPGDECTVRCRIRIAHCSAEEMGALLDGDLREWEAASPFSLPIPEPKDNN